MADRRAGMGWLLASIIVLAAFVRFSTLRVQSYWIDEAYTVGLARLDFLNMLSTIPKTESTPPLYYSLVWIWSRLFGTSEIGVRSLSALLGTVAVLVAYMIGREFVSPRAGLIAAAIAAVNPFLVWYSQEARAYALLILLAGVSLLFFGRAIKYGGAEIVAAWAVTSALALATHYFAAFLVVPEAVWLLRRGFQRKPILLGVASVAAVMVVLAPLALHQRKEGYGLEHVGLLTRAVQVPKQFLVGFGSPARNALAVLALMLALIGIVLLFRARDSLGRRMLPLLSVTLLAVLVPFGLAVVGPDLFDARNCVAALLPCLVLLAAGYASSRAGLATAAALAIVSLAVIATVVRDSELQRTDWRGAVRELGPAADGRAVMVVGSGGRFGPVELYLRSAQRMKSTGADVREVALLGIRKEVTSATLRLPVGFVRTKRRRVQQLFVQSFRAERTHRLMPESLRRSYVGNYPAGSIRILFEPAPGLRSALRQASR